jgi:hypothetical protein
MNVSDDDYRTRLSELTSLREKFQIRADLLPADLALVGLVDDLLDASTAAIEFSGSSTRVVYPLVRTAFEAAQRIVALATDDDYVRVGTRAWLYYQYKDAAVRRKTAPEKAERWLEAVVSRMLEIWTPHNNEAEGLLASEGARLKESTRAKPRPPDNFMGRDLADVVQERYQRVWPAGIPNEVKQLNRGIYSALSRDSHARLRVEPAAFEIQPNGAVRVIPRRVDEDTRRRTLLNCLESSLTEAVGAVSYLADARRRIDAELLRHSAGRAIASELPPGFSPDLGLHLAHIGGAGTTFHFMNVPIHKLGVLPDGTASWSANIVLADGEYAATFDVPVALRGDLARVIRVSPMALAPSNEIRTHKLDGPPIVGVECRLGGMQSNGKESFVPLVVTRLK